MPLPDLARALLDQPRWVETRFMLLDARATVTGLSGDRRNFVASSTLWPLVSLVGRPDHAFIADAASRAPAGASILAAEEHAAHAEQALPGWRRVGAAIFGWPGGVSLPPAPPAAQARLLDAAEVAWLAHVPRALRRELATASSYSPIAGAFAGGAPVAFCYASAVTESLWDVSIDTLEGFRRRGHGTRAVWCLAAAMAARGKWPVWGAEDDNAASLAMASRLGFVPAGRLAVLRR